jgi:alkylation response protein AidB-like acyl-CoA dehydrogenase
MQEHATVQGRAALQPSLLERTKALHPLLNEQAPLAEAQGRLTDATVRALDEAGLFGFYMPRCFGGSEIWPMEALEVIEALSYGDASTAWVAMALQVAGGTAAAYLVPSAAKEIFGERIPLIAGQGAPFGRADIVPGGYRLSGHYGYGSGALHSSWLHTGGLVYESGRARTVPNMRNPDARIFITRTTDAELKENWDVLGLIATGSVDYVIKDLFVPEEFTHRQNAKRPHQGGDLYRLGISGLSTSGHTGFALGVARRALDEIAALAVAPKRPSPLAEFGGENSFHEQYGRAEAQLRAARALVFEVWNEAQTSIQRGNDLSVREMTLLRLALNHVTTVAADVTEFAYRFGGGVAARSGPLQRMFKDMHTATQHMTVSPTILRESAKELLGLLKGKVWGSRIMIDPE